MLPNLLSLKVVPGLNTCGWRGWLAGGIACWLLAVEQVGAAEAPATGVRSLRFAASTAAEARAWQGQSRERLYLLMMGGELPTRGPLNPRVLREEEQSSAGYRLIELQIQTRPDRQAHVWMALPKVVSQPCAAVLALHGHGGTGEQVVRGQGPYLYGRRLAELGLVVISPDIGSHTLQRTDWTLMGERTWDAIRCVDYLVTRPEVDARRLAVCGLSLGGETTMYVAALDQRLQLVCSSGWLTTVENMKPGHCPCWNFPGLEAHFDFADIFACVAPRPLICEIGEQERAPGGFPVPIARQAFRELEPAYAVLGARDELQLDVHPGGHVFVGNAFWPRLKAWAGVTE